jgi:hypothetical protein
MPLDLNSLPIPDLNLPTKDGYDDEGLPNQFEINMHWGYDDEALPDLNIGIDPFEHSEYNVQQQHDGSLNQMQQTAPGTLLH